MAVALVTCITAPAGAQNLMLSGGVQRDVQRFPEGDAPARLDGSATGWMAGADVRLRNHLALAVEWSDAGTIEDARTTALDIDGRTVAITSTFRHRTRTAAALGGYSHMLSSRVRVAYLGGVSSTQVRRDFASNAPGLVLVGPSDPSASGRSTLVDRSWGMTGGVDAVRPNQMAAPCGRRPAGPEDHLAAGCLRMECQDVRRRGVGTVKKRLLPCAVAVLAVLATPLFAQERNAGKYGAMFSWWYDELPAATLYPPKFPWNAQDPAWWTAIVTQARDAGLGWLAPDCLGRGDHRRSRVPCAAATGHRPGGARSQDRPLRRYDVGGAAEEPRARPRVDAGRSLRPLRSRREPAKAGSSTSTTSSGSASSRRFRRPIA